MPNNKNRLIFIVLFVAILGMMLYIIFKDTSPKKTIPGPVQTASPHTVIAKVGAENIYQKDFATEERTYPKIPNIDVKDILMKKMIKDSKVLQAAEKEGLIKLDNTIYNSPDKDYQKRISKIEEVESLVKKRQEKTKGSVISIWCYNNSKPNELDAEVAKSLAFRKISAVYDSVKNKRMTMKDAAKQLQSDTSLETLDIAYKANAIFEFEVGPKDQISFDKTFEAQVRKLEPGQITDIYLAKDVDIKTKQMRDAVYMFAQIESKTKTGVTENFDEWYARKEKAYAVQLY